MAVMLLMRQSLWVLLWLSLILLLVTSAVAVSWSFGWRTGERRHLIIAKLRRRALRTICIWIKMVKRSRVFQRSDTRHLVFPERLLDFRWHWKNLARSHGAMSLNLRGNLRPTVLRPAMILRAACAAAANCWNSFQNRN